MSGPSGQMHLSHVHDNLSSLMRYLGRNWIRPWGTMDINEVNYRGGTPPQVVQSLCPDPSEPHLLACFVHPTLVRDCVIPAGRANPGSNLWLVRWSVVAAESYSEKPNDEGRKADETVESVLG